MLTQQINHTQPIFKVKEGTYGTAHIEVTNFNPVSLPQREKKLSKSYNIDSHEYLRKNMKWLNSNNDVISPEMGELSQKGIPIAFLSINEILRIKGLLNSEGNKMRGHYSNTQWKDVLNDELQLRDRKCNVIAKKIMYICSLNKKNGMHDLLTKNNDIFIKVVK